METKYYTPEIEEFHVGFECERVNQDDNRAISLKWDTRADNQKHAADNDLISKGEKHGSAKLTEKEVLEIRASNLTHIELSIIYNTTRPNITKIKNNQRWKDI